VHRVSTAGGSIVLDDHADVAGRVSTRTGNPSQNAHVGGGIVIDVATSTSVRIARGERDSRETILLPVHQCRLVLQPPRGCRAGRGVQGPLIFERKVMLYVSDTATIGDVVGATSVRFSGCLRERMNARKDCALTRGREFLQRVRARRREESVQVPAAASSRTSRDSRSGWRRCPLRRRVRWCRSRSPSPLNSGRSCDRRLRAAARRCARFGKTRVTPVQSRPQCLVRGGAVRHPS